MEGRPTEVIFRAFAILWGTLEHGGIMKIIFRLDSLLSAIWPQYSILNGFVNETCQEITQEASD